MENKGQRRLAAIMFTDMVGYSALTQRDETLSMQLLAEHFQLLRSIFPRFDGSEVKTIGDAFLVEFPSALEAARCAIEIQKRLWERNQQEPPERQIRLRVGIHAGDVIHSEGDVFGDGVNIAARIEPCAPPGGICLSEDIARAIRNKLEFPLADLGRKQLKNIAEPMRVYAVALPWLSKQDLEAAVDRFKAPSQPAPQGLAGKGLGWLRGDGDPRMARRRQAAAGVLALLAVVLGAAVFWPSSTPSSLRLALLPLEYTGPPEKSATAKMLPALLVESLLESPRLVVTPFDSSRHVPAEAEASDAARQLDVDWILRGQLELEAERYGVQLNLLDDQGLSRWKKRMDGQADEIFNVAERVTGEIQSSLGLGRGSAFHAMSRSEEAVRSYLDGMRFLEGWDMQSNFERAQKAFARAVELDPSFGEAYAGLAQAAWKAYEETRDVQEVAAALQAAQKAVQLIPDHPEAHLALGVVQLGRGLSQEAVLSFKNALERAPADDAVCRRIADAYMSLGRDPEAEEMYKRAVGLKPDFWQNYRALGNFYLAGGRYEKAREMYRKVVELRPDSDIGYNNLALAHLAVGEMEEAKLNLEKALRIQPNFAGFTNLGVIYYSMRRYEQAAEQFRQAAELANDFTPWANLGDAYRQLKRSEEAGKAYEKAIELTSERLAVNPSDPALRVALAYSLAGAGRCKRAVREASAGVSQGSREEPWLHYYAGVAFALCGQDDQAAREIQAAMEGGLVADVESNPDLQKLLERPVLKRLIQSKKISPDG